MTSLDYNRAAALDRALDGHDIDLPLIDPDTLRVMELLRDDAAQLDVGELPHAASLRRRLLEQVAAEGATSRRGSRTGALHRTRRVGHRALMHGLCALAVCACTAAAASQTDSTAGTVVRTAARAVGDTLHLPMPAPAAAGERRTPARTAPPTTTAPAATGGDAIASPPDEGAIDLGRPDAGGHDPRHAEMDEPAGGMAPRPPRQGDEGPREPGGLDGGPRPDLQQAPQPQPQPLPGAVRPPAPGGQQPPVAVQPAPVQPKPPLAPAPTGDTPPVGTQPPRPATTPTQPPIGQPKPPLPGGTAPQPVPQPAPQPVG